jgi:hypothetical protein
LAKTQQTAAARANTMAAILKIKFAAFMQKTSLIQSIVVFYTMIRQNTIARDTFSCFLPRVGF